MRYALYARYSSDNQSESSCEDQFRLCREAVAKDGGTIVREYSDHAISGASTLNRPEFQQMMLNAEAGNFDIIFAEDLSRLSRNFKDPAVLFEKLEYLGIKLITRTDGEITPLHIGLQGTMNALYLKDLADKTKRGQRGRVENGFIPGGLTYGYDMGRELDSKGDRIPGIRTINQGQADIVRRIYESYIDGKSAKIIAKELNGESILSPRGGEWNASTINGNKARRNGILHNELYIGFIIYNRQSFKKDPSTGNRVAKPNPEREWIVKEAPELRIITDELWSQVQNIKATNAPKQVSKRRRPKRLLSGIVSCGECGGGYTIIGTNRFGCSSHREKGTCSNNRTISVEKLEERVLNGLKEHLLEPNMVAEYTKTYIAALKRHRSQNTTQRHTKKRELDGLTRKISLIIDAIEDGVDTAAMRDRLKHHSLRQTQLTEKLKEVENPSVVEFHPNLPDMYQRRIEALQSALNEEGIRHKAIQILHTLIDRIVLHPGSKRGEIHIELHGDIAALLHLMEQKGNDSGEVMNWLVAGARNRRYLHLNFASFL